MQKYAIVRIKGHQYRVSEGDEILVDKAEEKEVKAEVLLSVNDDKVLIGKPILKDVVVKTKILGEEKGDKIRIFTYKSKSRYRKTRGFRAQYTKLLIQKIS